MVASMIDLQGGAPDTHETLILENKPYHLKLAGIQKMRHPTPSSPRGPHWKNKREEEDGKDEEDEKLCQGLKIYFEVGFKEMVSGEMHRSSPAGLELEQPSWH